MNVMSIRMWLIAGLTGALTIGLAGCNKPANGSGGGKGASPTPTEKVKVTLGSSKVQPVQRSVSVVGTLYGDEETVISAKIAGRIVDVFRDMGDRVTLGEPLAQIDETDYKLELAQRQSAIGATLAKLGLTEMPKGNFDPSQVPTVVRAQRQMENAQAKLNRGKQLFEAKPPLMSEQDFADLQTGYDVAKSNYDVELLTARSLLADAQMRKADLNVSQQRVADTTVRAPGKSGVGSGHAAVTLATTQPTPPYAVAARFVSVGEYVKEGAALFKLVADNPIKFRAQVPERFVDEVKAGQTVSVTVAAYKDAFSGKIARINPQIDLANRMFQVEVLVDNPKGLLRPGAFATGSIATYVEPQVTFVPQEAVIAFAGVKKVFTVKDGKAVEAVIDTAPGKEANYVEVTRGLTGEQPVVVTGASKLAGGTPVEVMGN